MSTMERFIIFKKIAISPIKNLFLILNQTKLSHGLQFI